MIDYIIPLFMGMAVVFLYLGASFLAGAIKDNEVAMFIFGFVTVFFSGTFFALSILKTILWIRGL